MSTTKALFGSSNEEVARIGLGCMGMSGVYGQTSDQDCIKTIHRALELGCNFLDTADVYGMGHNEELIANALQGRRESVFLATKFGLSGISNSPGPLKSNGRPEYVKWACEQSLKRLNTEVIDLYYLHRLDKEVPIEETVGAMSELVQAGKVRYLGLSEVSAKTLRRAHAIHPITALQSELSLWHTEPLTNILPTCEELNTAFVAYSPLGRGYLTGTVNTKSQFEDQDWRKIAPRFQAVALEQNQKLLDQILRIASEMQVTPSQIALAWLLHQSSLIFPIPGTKRVSYLEDNWNSLQIALDSTSLLTLNQLAKNLVVVGHRYPEKAQGLLENS